MSANPFADKVLFDFGDVKCCEGVDIEPKIRLGLHKVRKLGYELTVDVLVVVIEESEILLVFMLLQVGIEQHVLRLTHQIHQIFRAVIHCLLFVTLQLLCHLIYLRLLLSKMRQCSITELFDFHS